MGMGRTRLSVTYGETPEYDLCHAGVRFSRSDSIACSVQGERTEGLTLIRWGIPPTRRSSHLHTCSTDRSGSCTPRTGSSCIQARRCSRRTSSFGSTAPEHTHGRTRRSCRRRSSDRNNPIPSRPIRKGSSVPRSRGSTATSRRPRRRPRAPRTSSRSRRSARDRSGRLCIRGIRRRPRTPRTRERMRVRRRDRFRARRRWCHNRRSCADRTKGPRTLLSTSPGRTNHRSGSSRTRERRQWRRRRPRATRRNRAPTCHPPSGRRPMPCPS